MISQAIIQILARFAFPAIFAGSFLFGETVIITAAFLSVQGLWSPLNVFWLAWLGTLSSDSVWFFFGRGIFTLLGRWEYYQKKTENLIKNLNGSSRRRQFIYLLFFKFLYGTRIITIIYLSLHKMRFWRFLFFDSIGTTIWLVVMILIGWLAGKGAVNLLPVVDNIKYLITAIIAVIIGVKLLTLWFSKKVAKG